jgi:hypothetical protein
MKGSLKLAVAALAQAAIAAASPIYISASASVGSCIAPGGFSSASCSGNSADGSGTGFVDAVINPTGFGTVALVGTADNLNSSASAGESPMASGGIAGYDPGFVATAPGHANGSSGYIFVAPYLTGDFYGVCAATAGTDGDCFFDFSISESVTVGNGPAYSFQNCCGGGIATGFVFGSNGNANFTSVQYLEPNSTTVPGFLVPVVFGSAYQLTYQLSVSADINCFEADCPQGGSAYFTADFSDPPILTVLDSNMNPIPGATIESEAGFIYTGMQASVPEPGTVWLVLTGVVLGLVHLSKKEITRLLFLRPPENFK